MLTFYLLLPKAFKYCLHCSVLALKIINWVLLGEIFSSFLVFSGGVGIVIPGHSASLILFDFLLLLLVLGEIDMC